MQRFDIALAMGGNMQFARWTFSYLDLAASAALTAAINFLANPPINSTTIFQIPQGGKMMGVCIQHTTAFAGTAITDVTVSVGLPSPGSATFFTNTFDIFQAVANNTLLEASMFKLGGNAASGVIANFTSVGGNLSALTAGSVNIYLAWLNVSTPSS